MRASLRKGRDHVQTLEAQVPACAGQDDAQEGAAMTATAWYEPWSPTVGQRVRIRLSGECQASHTPVSDGTYGVVKAVEWFRDDPTPHPVEDPDGSDYAAALRYRGHWYDVDFEHPVPDAEEGRMIRSDLFAAIELEPA